MKTIAQTRDSSHQSLALSALGMIRDIPLVELAPIISHIAELTERARHGSRSTTMGGVPKEVFELLVGMAGFCASVQIVHEVWKGNEFLGFALKLRDPATEVGDAWAGLYHSPCTVIRRFDTPASALERDFRDAGDDLLPMRPGIQFLGVTIHDEPERRCACATIMHRRKVSVVDVEGFEGEWTIFTPDEVRRGDPRIVDHNCYLLQWVLDPHRPSFADVRGGWKPVGR